jgi:ATP-dependent DNA helicase PIF1
VLTVGSPVVLRNLTLKDGLCNGTRLICKSFKPHVIEAEIITGSKKGNTVFIPRIPLTPSEVDLPFDMRRLQFPVRLAYSMTINKAQGQTLNTVGINLQTPVFSHGQLYVALSRISNCDNLYLLVQTNKESHSDSIPDCSTLNVVYHEIL